MHRWNRIAFDCRISGSLVVLVYRETQVVQHKTVFQNIFTVSFYVSINKIIDGCNEQKEIYLMTHLQE